MSGVLNEQEMQMLRERMRDGEAGARKPAVATEILATELRLAQLTVRLESVLTDFREATAQALSRERKLRSEVELDRLTLLATAQVKDLVGAGITILLRCGDQPAVAVVSRVLVAEMIERMFGGSGSVAASQDFTPLMARVVRRIADLTCLAWNQHAGKAAPVKLVVEQVLAAPSTRAFLSEVAPVVHVPLHVVLSAESVATISLLIPLASFALEAPASAPTNAALYRALVSSIPVQVRVELGQATVSMAALANLQIGQVFRLDSSTQEPVSVLVGDERIWRARPTVREHHIGVTIAAWDVQENS
jgi:flagellar motor switch protein FliM